MFADFASINCPFHVVPLPNSFVALWWLFSTIVSINSIFLSSHLQMKVYLKDIYLAGLTYHRIFALVHG